MGADYDHLRAFVLASTKLHLANRSALLALRGQMEVVSEHLLNVAPLESQDLEARLKEIRDIVEETYSDVDERTDSLLSALEVYVNG